MIKRTIKTPFTVELRVRYVAPHKRFGRRATFGNEYRVDAFIPEIDFAVTVAGPYKTEAEADEMFVKFANDHMESSK